MQHGGDGIQAHCRIFTHQQFLLIRQGKGQKFDQSRTYPTGIFIGRGESGIWWLKLINDLFEQVHQLLMACRDWNERSGAL